MSREIDYYSYIKGVLDYGGSGFFSSNENAELLDKMAKLPKDEAKELFRAGVYYNIFIGPDITHLMVSGEIDDELIVFMWKTLNEKGKKELFDDWGYFGMDDEIPKLTKLFSKLLPHMDKKMVEWFVEENKNNEELETLVKMCHV